MKSAASVDFSLHACLLLTCSICALAIAFLLPDGKPFADQGFNWYINTGQLSLFAPRLAYAFFCAAVSISAYFCFRFHDRLFSILKRIPQVNLVIALSFAAFGLASICLYAKDFRVFVGTASICVLAVFVGRKLPEKSIGYVALAIAACAFLIAVVPGLSAIPDLSAHFPESIADIQSHQAQTTAADLRLAQGCKLFESVSGRYGVLWQSLLGAYTKLVHPLSVGDAIMFTRWLQSIFFALVAIAYLKFGRRALAPASLAVLFIAPWMELNQLYFLFPQVTAWRYMGFVMAPLLVLLLEKTSLKTRCLVLGATAGFALLSDFASGAAISCGLLAYLIFRKDKGGIIRALLLFFAGICSALGVFLLFFVCIFGYMPSVPAFLADLKMTIWQCAGGTAPALGYEFDPLAIVIILHTAYIAVKLAGRGPRSLVSRDALRLCIAVASMLWFVHYVNEPNTFALRTCRFLYGFLLIDLLRTVIVSLKRKREPSEPLWMLNLILVAVIIPACVLSYQPALKKVLAGEKNKNARTLPKTLVSGVYLPAEVGNALLQKSEFLKNTAQRPVVYLTGDSSFVPKLSGLASFIALSDPYSELVFSNQSERFMKTIGNSGAEKIYVDDPDFITAKGVSRRSCFDYLRVMLARNYKLSATESGWQIWIPKAVAEPNSKTRE